MFEARRATPWQVLVVEDDPAVASVHAQVVGRISRLQVAGVVARGEDALAWLAHHRCDLLLLDLNLAGMGGIALLKRLRVLGHPAEVIALTASRDATDVQATVQWGAIDYLVKPFSIERLRQSLGLFLHRAGALHAGTLEQADVDRFCASGREPRRTVPKGLSQNGVSLVRSALLANDGAQSSADVADATGLARVTARRYLEYLVVTDQATVEAYPSGPGRPRKLYQASA